MELTETEIPPPKKTWRVELEQSAAVGLVRNSNEYDGES